MTQPIQPTIGVGPFLGIKDRPYDQKILIPVRWWEIEPSTVYFRYLWLTQNKLTITGVFGERYSADEYPRVVVWRGEQYLEDGHHRAVLAGYLLTLAQGEQHMPMRVYFA